MYRVYDADNKRWRDDIVVFDDNTLGIVKYTFFHNLKVDIIINESPYVVHMDTGITDKNGKNIFEGDICTCPNDSTGIVAYSTQTGSYCIFDNDNSLYYILNDENGGYTEVIGNVFEGIVVSQGDS